MRPLIISRKTKSGMGGLSRFYAELSKEFPDKIPISPDSLGNVLKLPFKKPTHIYLSDATLLPIGIVLKFLFRKPLIVTAHGLDITFKNPLYQKMIHALLPKADAIVLDSAPTKKLLQGFKLKNNAKVIPLGVTIRQLEKSESIHLPSLKNKIILTTVGNLVKRKGHAWFISKVMPYLDQSFIYLIVGEGSEREAIMHTIKENRLEKRVFLLGQLTHAELRFVLGKTNIYVAPNQHLDGNFESFGIAAGEAAALGIPVVASNVDGISQAIQNSKNGILIPPTPNNFIEILTQLKSQSLRKRIGDRAKFFTHKHYQWSKTARAYSSLFRSLSS